MTEKRQKLEQEHKEKNERRLVEKETRISEAMEVSLALPESGQLKERKFLATFVGDPSVETPLVYTEVHRHIKRSSDQWLSLFFYKV